MFSAIPKGRDIPAVFYVNKDTFDLIKEIAFSLETYVIRIDSRSGISLSKGAWCIATRPTLFISASW